ncbi:MAG: PIN domain-containing protein [Candidatus Brocadiia bacterium]
MKVLLDTSILVAALVEAHPAHSRAFMWLRKARRKEFELIIACHTLAELYAVLTSLPVSPRIAPATARRLIKDSVLPWAKVISLSASEYEATINDLAELGIAGGAVYDGLIARAASKGGAEKLVTLNAEDFKRVAPQMANEIVEP